LGSGMEISIKDLVELIVKLTGFEGKVIWDKSKPDGQPRRALDVTRAKDYFGFQAKTPFEEGLRNTINYFIEHQDQID
jgi:GDP-L-fucose synthase